MASYLQSVHVVVSDRKNPVEDPQNPGTLSHYEADILASYDYYPPSIKQPGINMPGKC